MPPKKKNAGRQRRMWMIDPIYRKFTAKAFKNLTSPEFYEFFQNMLKNGEQNFQFSNRKLDMQVDMRWVEIIEATIPAFMEISRNPRVIITQEELITNVVQAKKIDSQVVRHLCAHSYLVDAIDEKGDVQPGKVLNIYKEETWNTYENRFVWTLIVKTYEFVAKRYRDMSEYMNDEFGATLRIDTTAQSDLEFLKIKSEMKITQKDSLMDTDDKQGSIFARIKKMYMDLNSLMNSKFAKEMDKFSKVYPPLVMTNAIKKNPHLKKCHLLWNFLLAYMDVGYTVQVIEQNPEINEKFEQDIFNNIMFTYIILKGYLEDNRDRALDRKNKARVNTIRPKYIKQLVEEFVKDYNLPDVEVRKILIEELTKEQLMREEREERYRIVEEQRKSLERQRREQEKLEAKQKKLAEKEAAKKARAEERARIKAEKEKEKAREKKEKERIKKQKQDERRAVLIATELETQLGNIAARKAKLTSRIK